MASRSALIALLVAVSCAAVASAVTFNVGDTQGWNTGVDYTTWAQGKTFSEGDQLVFTFTTGRHDVAVVDKSGYDGCSGSSSQNTINNGPATVNLTSGTHYYICTFPGHCSSSGGMKLAVTVGSGSGGAPTPSTPSTPEIPPTPGTPSTPSPKNAAPARYTAAPALAVAAAVLLKLALF